MNYFEKHIGDYLKDTAHLSLLEHGIYNRLFDVYYTREGAIPDDQAARLISARTPQEREALRSVLAEYFVLGDDGWHQARCDEEIARFKSKQDKARASANARWSKDEAHSERNANAYADGMRTHSERNANGMHRAPVPSNQTPDTNKTPPTPKGVESGFTAFWNAWPRSNRKGGKAECEKLWRSQKLETHAETIVDHVKAMASTEGWTKQGGEFVPAPLVYLRGKRWDGADLNGSPQQGLQLLGAI